MNSPESTNNALLVRFQSIMWYIYVGYLTLACLLLVTKFEMGLKFSKWGVTAVLAATVIQLFFMAVDFRRSGKKNFMILSLVLILVILVSTSVGIWII